MKTETIVVAGVAAVLVYLYLRAEKGADQPDQPSTLQGLVRLGAKVNELWQSKTDDSETDDGVDAESSSKGSVAISFATGFFS